MGRFPFPCIFSEKITATMRIYISLKHILLWINLIGKERSWQHVLLGYNCYSAMVGFVKKLERRPHARRADLAHSPCACEEPLWICFFFFLGPSLSPSTNPRIRNLRLQLLHNKPTSQYEDWEFYSTTVVRRFALEKCCGVLKAWL